MSKKHQQGFTIIELLIAIVTFSLVLLVVTGAIIQFSKVYYKGVATSKTQEAVRLVSEDMTRAAQFSKSAVTSVPGVYCFGDKRYRYDIGNTPSKGIGLIADESSNCDTSSPGKTDSRQLLGENMKLLRLDVTQAPDKVTMKLIIGYGEDITPSADPLVIPSCPAVIVGGNFCAVGAITNTVTRRL